MVIDERIAEMLAFAIVNPYTGQIDIGLYRRQLADDLTLTLFIQKGKGKVSLTSLRKITEAEISNVTKTLSPLKCLYNGPLRSGKYYIARFHFSDPAKEPPVFASPLDKYLTAVRPKPAADKLNGVNPKPPPQRAPAQSRPATRPYDESAQRLPTLPVAKEPAKPRPPRWLDLTDEQCHICHRPLTDPLSLRVCIGSICRGRIEKLEERNADMWENISREELERIWATYNSYDLKEAAKLI